MARMVQLFVSLTYTTLAAASTATATGRLKRAAVPAALVVPVLAAMLPASVVTANVERFSTRILWQLVSATNNTDRAVSTVTLFGAQNRAAAPVPSTVPLAAPAVPASVVTTPANVTFLQLTGHGNEICCCKMMHHLHANATLTEWCCCQCRRRTNTDSPHQR